MFNFIKKLFESSPSYGMGALQSPSDYRNIQLASIQEPAKIPSKYEIELPEVIDQGTKSKCVGSAISKVAEYFLYMKKGKTVVPLSDDDLYEQCKLVDGIPEIKGTYPTFGAKIACNSGIASIEAYKTGDEEIIKKSRAENKLKSYTFVTANFDSICQAIYQNGPITASFEISSDWFKGFITRILSTIGRHYVILNGYNYNGYILRGQNSWGKKWIGYIAGIFNSSIKPGKFEMSWLDYTSHIYDIISFTPVPDEILEEVKKQEYIFTTTMKLGSSGYEVKKLQEKLNSLGYYCGIPDGKFGKNTQRALINLQKNYGLGSDGIFGSKTRNILNGKIDTTSKIDLFCLGIQKHEGWYPGSRSYRNLSPGNIKYIGQKRAIGKDSAGFCIFSSYEDGFAELKDIVLRCKNGESSVYKQSFNFYDFFNIYAPSSDNNNPKIYAEFVASFVGVPPKTKIMDLF